MPTEPPDKSIRKVSKMSLDASPEFKKAVRTLKKKYRSIGKDIAPVLMQIETGQLPGEQITGTGFVVYKVRVKNRDIKKGKSAGYRIIYQVESHNSVVLITIYAKSDQTDISNKAVKKIIAAISQSDS